MYNQVWNAQSAIEYSKKEQEREMQPKFQIAELQKQTEILSKANEFTQMNAEQIKQLVECTKQNQITAEKQAKSSNNLATIAILISIFALIINVIQVFK